MLVTGTTGYIGGRLVPRLLAAGHEVRALARDPGKLRDVPWHGDVEIARGDVTDPDAMAKACAEVGVVYYMVHSLSTRGFASTDRQGALVTAQAARDAGVKRIVYLGGLRPSGDEALSEHLASRGEVGEIFLRSGVPSAVLQAAVILGAGSASFEMLRYLTERLPVMVTPQWVGTKVQPIAVGDVLHYLVGVADLPAEVNRTFDIGGPDVLTYRQMMQQYAKVAELPPRRVLPVPLLTPKLSSHWVNLVTPVPRSLATPLIESLVHEMICDEHDIARYVPDPPEGLTGYARAVELALARISAGEVETRWSDASLSGVPSDPLPSDPDWSGGSVYVDERRAETTATSDELWRVVTGIGGANGWYSFPLAWAVRGWADRAAGGVGLRRGRRNPTTLHVGEALDWWRVEVLDEAAPERLLRLRAEMKVPGLAWLELGVSAGSEGGSVYRQKAIFVPHGLAGQAYWWAVAPFHGVVFGGMVRNIVGAAEGRLAESR
ncbi:MAG TPA: SDR family oxidoreductase [Sporichthya sp.]|nr:SDR family oxidoreductase [Sporichthya sp.]